MLFGTFNQTLVYFIFVRFLSHFSISHEPFNGPQVKVNLKAKFQRLRLDLHLIHTYPKDFWLRQ